MRRCWFVGLAAVTALLVPGVGRSEPADAAIPARVDVGDASVWEGDTGARSIAFSVTVSDPITTSAIVSYHLMAGTATAPGDFNDLLGVTKTLTFSPGSAQSKFVTVKVKPDLVDEGDETLSVMVLGVTGGAVQGTTVATGTILDDDPGSGVRVGVSDATLSEGDSGKNRTAKFWVTLSEAALVPVSVHAMTMDSGTTAGLDYTAKMMTLSFNPGQMAKAFTVVVKPDPFPEIDEQFHVMLSEVSGATLADDTGWGTIVTDDSGAMASQSFTVGPFNLAALGQAGSENDSSGYLSRPAGSFGIKTMTFDLVDQNGSPVNIHDVHLHHIVAFDWSANDAVCPGYPVRFSGSGKERTALTLGDSYAYKVEAADQSWSAAWHLMNMSAQARTVYIKYTVGYVAYDSPAAQRSVTPYWYDVTGPCTNSEYNVPGNGGAGSVHSKSRIFSAPKNGTRVLVPGHLHDGGIDLTLKRTATGQTICTNVAEYPMPGMLHSITACNDPTTVTAGEQFTTTAHYDNSAPIIGAMGIQLTYVWEP